MRKRTHKRPLNYILKWVEKMLTTKDIQTGIYKFQNKYAISRATLFGSRAEGKARENSDVDLIVEFSKPVSLLTLASLKEDLEDLWKLPVDVIHGPLSNEDFLEIQKEVILYAS